MKNENDFDKYLGLHLKAIRKSILRITQIEMGTLLQGLDQTAVSRIEKGSQKVTLFQMKIYSDLSQIKIDDILKGNLSYRKSNAEMERASPNFSVYRNQLPSTQTTHHPFSQKNLEQKVPSPTKSEGIDSLYWKEQRIRANLTQKEVAKKLGYNSSQLVSNWECGKCSPSKKDIPTLLSLYQVDIPSYIELVLDTQRKKLINTLKKKSGTDG